MIGLIKGLYIHIPFCRNICSYCDFCKLVAKPELIDNYLQSLATELGHVRSLLDMIETIYIGGGTPTSLSAPAFGRVLKMITNNLNTRTITEYTVEANPEDIDYSRASLMRDAGVTRVSLGVQTFDMDIRQHMHRKHGFATIKKAVDILRDFDFDTNIDMIYGYPGQSIDSVNNDLELLLKLDPAHVSYYQLILEEKTELGYLVRKGVLFLDEDQAFEQGELVNLRLEEAGLRRYEISNYARPGRESKHNLFYWNLEEYLGIGLGAASQYGHRRYHNPDRISDYLNQVLEFGHPLETVEEFEPEKETIILGLRLVEGISLTAFEKRFGRSPFTLFPGLRKHLDNSLLELRGTRLRLTDRGLDLANQVFLAVI